MFVFAIGILSAWSLSLNRLASKSSYSVFLKAIGASELWPIPPSSRIRNMLANASAGNAFGWCRAGLSDVNANLK